MRNKTIYTIYREIFLNGTLRFFKTYVIDNKTSINNVYGLFVNAQRSYNSKLRQSIENEILNGQLRQKSGPGFYNYLILDGRRLKTILKKYSSGSNATIDNVDMEAFLKTIV